VRRDVVRALPISRRLASAVALFLAAIAAGIVGYIVLADMSFIDALYQTVTTITTVGFREVRPFGTGAKLFTVFLVMAGVGIALYTLTLIVQESLEGDIRSRFYRRRKELEIERMRDHYILCGFGRVGQEIARELRDRKELFVVVEEREDSVERARAFGYHVIEGDGSQERVLLQAGLPEAKCLLAASDSDAGNTYITLTARSINPSCFIVARVAYPHNEEKLKLAGADRVLSLYSMGGRRMVLMALQPLAADFMDTLATGRHGDLVLAEFEANRENGLAGTSCGQLLANAGSATLLGVRHTDGRLTVGPGAAEQLHDGDIVMVLAEEQEIASMQAAVAR
jgi:voltage-gated potassium channel